MTAVHGEWSEIRTQTYVPCNIPALLSNLLQLVEFLKSARISGWDFWKFGARKLLETQPGPQPAAPESAPKPRLHSFKVRSPSWVSEALRGSERRILAFDTFL